MTTSASIATALADLDSPSQITSALETLCDDLVAKAGTDLAALVLYGSLARRRYRPGRSDVNLAIVLREISPSALSKIAPPLRVAWRAAWVEPFVLTPAEIPQLAQVFPLKLLDIQAHHVVLYGEDPFVDLRVSPDRIRWRLAQQLRNLGLRLRRRYLAVGDDPPLLCRLLADSARSLAVDLASLMRLAGRPVPPEDRTDAILQAAAEVFALDKPALEELASLRRARRPPPELDLLFSKMLATIDAALAQVPNLEGGP